MIHSSRDDTDGNMIPGNLKKITSLERKHKQPFENGWMMMKTFQREETPWGKGSRGSGCYTGNTMNRANGNGKICISWQPPFYFLYKFDCSVTSSKGNHTDMVVFL